jgi:hypothetical protein
MPRFAANLSMLYPELPFLDRFAAAARDGFEGVEFLFPYEHAPEVLADRLQAARPAAGAVQRAARQLGWRRARDGLPARPREEFRAGIREALRYAKVLRCPRVHVMAGLLPQGSHARRCGRRTWPTCAGRRPRRRKGGREPAAGADQPARHPGLLPEPPGPCPRRSSARSARPTCRCRWTCTTARSSRATSPPRSGSTCRPAVSATSRSRACRSATSPTWAS